MRGPEAVLVYLIAAAVARPRRALRKVAFHSTGTTPETRFVEHGQASFAGDIAGSDRVQNKTPSCDVTSLIRLAKNSRPKAGYDAIAVLGCPLVIRGRSF